MKIAYYLSWYITITKFSKSLTLFTAPPHCHCAYEDLHFNWMLIWQIYPDSWLAPTKIHDWFSAFLSGFCSNGIASRDSNAGDVLCLCALVMLCFFTCGLCCFLSWAARDARLPHRMTPDPDSHYSHGEAVLMLCFLQSVPLDCLSCLHACFPAVFTALSLSTCVLPRW